VPKLLSEQPFPEKAVERQFQAQGAYGYKVQSKRQALGE
jgi:hypothetical protein